VADFEILAGIETTASNWLIQFQRALVVASIKALIKKYGFCSGNFLILVII